MTAILKRMLKEKFHFESKSSSREPGRPMGLPL